MVKSSLSHFSSSRSCSSKIVSGTGLRLSSMSLSSAIPAVATGPCRKEDILLENWTISRESSSASLIRVFWDFLPKGSFEYVEVISSDESKSHTSGFHRARSFKKSCKLSKSSVRVLYARNRCSSHVRRTPSRSRSSERSRRRCKSLSRANKVVSVISMRSVSSGDRFLCVAANTNRTEQSSIRRAIRTLKSSHLWWELLASLDLLYPITLSPFLSFPARRASRRVGHV